MSARVQNRLGFASLEEAVEHARSLLASGYERRGQWSLGQICKHLAGTMEMSRRGFPPLKVPLPMRLARPMVRWWVLSYGMPRGAPTLPLLVFGDHLKDAEGVEAFAAETRLYHAHSGPLAPSPLLGNLTREQWDRVHIGHAGHHLRFLVPLTSPVTPGSA
jgi:hypothetical protein